MLATLVPSRSSRPADLAAAHRDPFEPVVSLAHVPSREGVSLAVDLEPFGQLKRCPAWELSAEGFFISIYSYTLQFPYQMSDFN